MTVREIVDALNLKVLSGKKGLDKEISGAYSSDLLSDVMGNTDEGQVWITLQGHKNAIAVATLKELSAMILVQGHNPNADTLEVSNEEDLPVLSADLPAFELCGKLYQLLNS